MISIIFKILKIVVPIILLVLFIFSIILIFNIQNRLGASAAELAQESELAETIEVINYNGNFITVDQIILIEANMACDAPHWHTRERFAISTTGQEIYEPEDPCGLGTDSDLSIITILE